MTLLLQALLAARALIANPVTWTTGASARDAGNRPISSMSPDAVCFCAIGAVRRGCTLGPGLSVDYAVEGEIGRRLDAEVIRQHGPRTNCIDDSDAGLIIGVNDFKGRTATLAVFDAVIAQVRREEQIENLTQARALILDPDHWVQEIFARTADGERSHPLSEDACRFCAGGALLRVGNEDTLLIDSMAEAIERTSTRLHPEIPHGYSATVWVNDKSGHAAVIRVFDETIASLKIASLRG